MSMRPDTNVFDFELPSPNLFSFRACVSYMARSPLECLHRVEGESIVKRVDLNGRPRVLRIAASPTHSLLVQVLKGPPLDEGDGRECTTFLREWLDLDRQLDRFYDIAEGDALLGPVTKAFGGLRIVGVPDLFEALCWAIMGQQVNLAFAYALKQRLTSAYGDALEHEGTPYYKFPTPERVLDATVEDLRQLQLTRHKANAILETAKRMASGDLRKDKLLALGDWGRIDRELTSIRGVGPWTAQYVRMRCLRDPSSFPITDVGLHNAVKALLGWDRKPTLEELEQLFVPWRGWEAYATFYLWRTLY